MLVTVLTFLLVLLLKGNFPFALLLHGTFSKFVHLPILFKFEETGVQENRLLKFLRLFFTSYLPCLVFHKKSFLGYTVLHSGQRQQQSNILCHIRNTLSDIHKQQTFTPLVRRV
jgi:hypothetical protein